MSAHRTSGYGLIRRIMGRWGSAAGITVTVVVLLAGIAVITLVEVGDARPVLHWLHVHVLASASIAAVAAVAAVIVPLLQSRREDRREAQRAVSTSRSEKLKLVRAHCMIDPATGWLPELRRLDAIASPLRLGVHPAADIDQSTLGEQVPASNMPAYIERDIDGELDAALAAGGLVLLEGNSTAGKSRAAYEALRRLPEDTWLLAPGRESLRALLNEDVLDEATLRAAGIEPKDIVVWLNDLEYYLGPRGLDVHLLQALINASSRRLVVLATMRSSEYLRRRTRTQERPGGQEGSTRAERDLLEQARVIRVRRKFSDTECARAATLRWDPRISQALAHRRKYGLAEYMAAGPALWQRWQDALDVDHPEEVRVGGAIVAAALDCRRAGFAGPVPEALLRTLYPSYLSRPRPAQLSDETFAAALAWATEPVEASSALLVAADGGYETFDYLLDQLQAEHDAPGVPEATWRLLLDDIGPEDAWGIGMAAYRAGWLAFAEQAFRLGLRSADSSIIERCALGMADLANLLDDFYTADEWHKRAAHIADLPHDPAQRSALGKHLESAVEEWYLRVAGVGREPDEPGGRLIIEHENVVNHFDGASYHQTTTRKLTNQTAEPIDRYPFRIAVDRYPGDPERSRLQYERYPLTVAGSDIKAWHESQQGEREPMDFEVQQDLPSFKEIWLLFKNAQGAFPLMPGQSCSITYRYTVSDKHWGTWSKRKVRIPTRKLSLEFSFPTALGATLAGSETSPSARAHPAPMVITQRPDGEMTVFTWEVEPQLNAQYRFDWQFSHERDSEPPSASADLPGRGAHRAPNGSAHA